MSVAICAVRSRVRRHAACHPAQGVLRPEHARSGTVAIRAPRWHRLTSTLVCWQRAEQSGHARAQLTLDLSCCDTIRRAPRRPSKCHVLDFASGTQRSPARTPGGGALFPPPRPKSCGAARQSLRCRGRRRGRRSYEGIGWESGNWWLKLAHIRKIDAVALLGIRSDATTQCPA